jgi:hypothetical protein
VQRICGLRLTHDARKDGTYRCSFGGSMLRPEWRQTWVDQLSAAAGVPLGERRKLHRVGLLRIDEGGISNELATSGRDSTVPDQSGTDERQRKPGDDRKRREGKNSKRETAPRGVRLLGRGTLCRVQPQGRLRHETRPGGFRVECKVRNGEKPRVPATRRR